MAESHFESMSLPPGLKPYFQEYDTAQLDLAKDADLIIQRALEYGDWDEVHWLFEVYGSMRIRLFLYERGERWLRPVTFNYWRKLLKVRRMAQFPS
jgi:hypothetical protein